MKICWGWRVACPAASGLVRHRPKADAIKMENKTVIYYLCCSENTACRISAQASQSIVGQAVSRMLTGSGAASGARF
jgi:hypothetical protein